MAELDYNPLELDAHAFDLQQRLDQELDPPGLRGELSSTMAMYRAKVQAEGRQPFSYYLKERRFRDDRVRNMFRSPSVPGLPPGYTGPDEQAHRQRTAGIAYLSHITGRKPDEVAALFPSLRQAWARQHLKKDDISESDFFNQVSATFEMEENLVKGANDAALRGLPAGSSFSKWQRAGALMDWNDRRTANFQQRFERIRAALDEQLAPYRGIITETVSDLQRLMGAAEGNTDADWSSIADRLLSVPKEMRPLVLQSVMVNGAPDGDLKGFFQKTGENLYRGTASLVGGAPKTLNREMLLSARRRVKGMRIPVDAQDPIRAATGEAFASVNRDIMAAEFQGAEIPGVVPKRQTRPLTPEEEAAAMAQFDKALEAQEMIRTAQDIAEGTIDPAKSDGFWASGFYGMIRSAPQFAAAVVPGGWLAIGGQFAEDNYHQIRRDQPDIPREMAQAIAVASAPVQAIAETISDRFLLGRLPSFRALSKTPATSWAAQAKRLPWLVPKGATEYAEEGVQDVTPYMVQEVVSALSKDVPQAPWATALADWKAGHNELLSTVIWMTVVGHGVGTAADMGSLRYQAARPELLESAGFSPAASLEISTAAKAGDWQKVDSLMRLETNSGRVESDGSKLSGVRDNAADALQQIAAVNTQGEQTLEGLGILPTMKRTGSGWELSFPDGVTAMFETHEEATAIRRRHAEDQGFSLQREAWEAYERMERGAQPGQEFAVELSPQQMTGREAVQQGLATEEEMLGRVRDAEVLTDNGADEDADFDRAVAVANASASAREDALAAVQILGMNKTEYKDGVMRTTIRLFASDNPLAIIEEKFESYVDDMIVKGRRAWLLDALRDVESKTGDRLLHSEDDAQITNKNLREAWSHLGMAYMVGRSKRGDSSLLESWKQKGFRKAFAEIMRTKAAGALNAYATFFRSVWRRAAKLSKLRRDGGLRADLESELARSLGLEQAVHEAAVANEAQGIIDEAHLQHLEEMEEGGAAFSVIRHTHPGGTLDARLSKAFSAFQVKPELRQKLGLLAQQRLANVRRSRDTVIGKRTAHIAGLDEIAAKNWVANRTQEILSEKLKTLAPETVAAAYGDEALGLAKNQPVLRELMRNGKGRIAHPSRVPQSINEYEDMPAGLPPGFLAGTLTPDQAAEELHQAGLIAAPDVQMMWLAVESAFKTAASTREAMKTARAKVRALELEARKQARADAESSPEFHADQRQKVKAWLRTLDAVLSAFPAEVRAKVGGYVKMAGLTTDLQMLNELDRRIQKMDKELEKWLQSEITDRLDKLLEQASPKGAGGEKVKGNLGAEVHKWFDLVGTARAMDEDEAAAEMAKQEAIISDSEANAEAQDAALEFWTVLHQFGGWDAKSAAEMATALEAAEAVYRQGRDAWNAVLDQRKVERDALRKDAHADAGGEVTWTDAQKQAHTEASEGQRGSVKDWFNRHFSFQQVLATIFGKGKTMAHFEKKAREATRSRTDTMIRKIQEFRSGMMAAFRTQSWRDTQRALFALQQRVTDAPVTFYGEATIRRREAPADIVRLISDGKAQWGDYDFAKDFTQEDKDQLVRAMHANDAAPDKSKKGMLSFETMKPGPALAKGALSQLEAVHFTMLARQETYREAMERHGITADTLADMEAWLAPEARRIRAWLFDQYDAGYAPMNAVYSRMFGVALPRVQDYAPGYFEAEGKQTEMDPFGSGMEASGMAAGFLKKRKNHRARPVQIDALQAYWQHTQNTTHWLSWAETIQEMRSVFGNANLRRTMEARRGKALAGDVLWWIETLEKGGVRDSQANAFLAKIMRANVRIGLGYKVSVLLKQLPAALASLSDIPAGGWVRGLRRVLTRQAIMSPTEMFKLPTIQRRIESGYSPEMRTAMRGPTAKPSDVEDVLEWGMQRIAWTDAAFSSLSAAIAYDYHFTEAVKMGVPEAEARSIALEKAENTVGRTSQPGEIMDRSRLEIEAKGLGKLMFMFQSANRQAWSLVYAAVGDMARTGDMKTAARVLFTQFVLIPSMMQTMAGLVRYLFTDDEAEEAWALEDYLWAMALGPSSGIVFLGAGVRAIGNFFGGKNYGNRSDNPAVTAVTDFVGAGMEVLEGDFDTKDFGKLVTSASLLASGFTNIPTEAAGVGWNVLKQILGLVESAEAISEGAK